MSVCHCLQTGFCLFFFFLYKAWCFRHLTQVISFGVVMLLSPFCYSSSNQFLSSWIYPQKAQAQPSPSSAINSLGKDSKKTAVSLLLTPPGHPTANPLSTSPCTQLPVMTLQAKPSQLLLKSCSFHWASLHFPAGNTALRVYHSLNKLWHPRKIKVHNTRSFEAARDSRWWKWWNNSSLTRCVQHFYGKEPVAPTTRERHGTPDKFPATFHGWKKMAEKSRCNASWDWCSCPGCITAFLTHTKRLGGSIYI